MRCASRRSVGPEIERAAIPSAPTGAASDDRPTSSSSIAVAQPSRRTRASSPASASGSTIVAGVSGSSGAGVGAAERDQHLADRGAVVRDAAPDPLAGAEEVAALDLREVLDAERARARRG